MVQTVIVRSGEKIASHRLTRKAALLPPPLHARLLRRVGFDSVAFLNEVTSKRQRWEQLNKLLEYWDRRRPRGEHEKSSLIVRLPHEPVAAPLATPIVNLPIVPVAIASCTFVLYCMLAASN
jgi:hypothetical protein